MSNALTFELQQKTGQNIRQLQRLIMSRQMQQAIHFLQMPIMELTPLVDMEMEQNPILEYSKDREDEPELDLELKQLEEDHAERSLEEDTIPEKELTFAEGDFEIMRRLDEDFRDHFFESGNAPVKQTSDQDRLQTFLESSVCSEETLFEQLMRQAHEVFDDENQRALAEAIIGNLDESGYFTTSIQELAVLQRCSEEKIEEVLKAIQAFDPIGIGAANLRESLLIQLKSYGKADGLAYMIIDKHFDDLLHNRIPSIKKGLHCTAEEIEKAVDHDIAKLNLHPAAQLDHQVVSFITPDISLRQDNEELVVAINEDFMPKLRLNRRYMRMLDDETIPAETKDFIKQKVVSAKWMLRNIMQRNETLEKISNSLAKWQREFFLDPNGKLVPLTMKMLAEELDLHESTIARAVSGKYMDTPRGILALRFFFTKGLNTSDGVDISAKTARDIIQEIIDGEDKHHPFSDEVISFMMKEKGIQCARRTVAKYRAALKQGSAQQRRKF